MPSADARSGCRSCAGVVLGLSGERRWGAVGARRRLANERLTGRSVARIVKRVASDAGLDADAFSGHSLSAGLATAAAAAGVSERSIMKQTGHKSERMVRRYIRSGELFRDNAAGQVGL